MANLNKRHRFHFTIKDLMLLMLIAALALSGVLIYKKQQKDHTSEAVPSALAVQSTAASAPSAAPSPSPSASGSDSFLHTVYQSYDASSLPADYSTGFATTWKSSAAAAASYDLITIYTARDSDNRVYHDGLVLDNGRNYNLYFNASSSAASSLTVSVLNVDDGHVIAESSFSLVDTLQSFTYSFTSDGDYADAEISVTADNGNGQTVSIQGIRIIGSENINRVRINQVGYQSSASKRITFTEDSGDLFDVVNVSSKKIEYTGAIVNYAQNSSTGEYNGYGDFSSFNIPGTYYIRSQLGTVSEPFTISRDPDDALSDSLLLSLSYQRCGSRLSESWAGALAHEACHNSDAAVWLTNITADVHGGWHDAGDYGRYTITGAKAVSDLLFAYLSKPQLFGDASGPQAGNGVPDILDEARYELEWLLRMQDEYGNFYTKVVSQSFPGDDQAPETDASDLIILTGDSASTASAAGALAVGSIAFRSIDSAFADQCLAAAEKTGSLLKNLEMHSEYNPPEISAGTYYDGSDNDNRFYAFCALYAADGSQDWLRRAQELYASDEKCADGLSWAEVGGYGRYLYLATADQTSDTIFYEQMLESLKKEADRLMANARTDGYNSTLSSYTWGSSAVTANNGILLSMAYDFLGDVNYKTISNEQLAWIEGRNSLNQTFITGYGTHYPASIHNRLTLSHGFVPSGYVVGGPDASREDNITQQMKESVPDAKVYSDNVHSYSTNETAIYYSSAVLYLVTCCRE